MPSPLAGGRAPLGLALSLALVPAACRAAPAREPALEARAFAPISYEAEIANRAVRLAELSDSTPSRASASRRARTTC